MRRKEGGLGLLPVVEVAELVIELYYSKAAFSVLIASGAHTLHLQDTHRPPLFSLARADHLSLQQHIYSTFLDLFGG